MRPQVLTSSELGIVGKHGNGDCVGSRSDQQAQGWYWSERAAAAAAAACACGSVCVCSDNNSSNRRSRLACVVGSFVLRRRTFWLRNSNKYQCGGNDSYGCNDGHQSVRPRVQCKKC